jgi:putative transposase
LLEKWTRRDALLAFYDFPFATVRHRTVRSKGCSPTRPRSMIFNLAEAAEKHWRRLDGHCQLPKVILGIKFIDEIEVVESQAQVAARPLPSPRFGYSSRGTPRSD